MNSKKSTEELFDLYMQERANKNWSSAEKVYEEIVERGYKVVRTLGKGWEMLPRDKQRV